MTSKTGNKIKIGVTISPYLKEQADELLETEKFSSMSDLVGIALAEFIGSYNRRQKEKEAKSPNSEPVVVEEWIG